MRARVLVLLTVLTLGQAPASLASSTQTLPFGTVQYMAIDDAHSHVFFTGAAVAGTTGSGDAIAVMNFNGSAATTITGESGAAGMAINAGKLYVARCGTTSIDVFDTATLAKVDTLSTSYPMQDPCDLAVTDGRVWVDEWLSSGGPVEPASITLTTPHVEKHIYPGGGAAFTTDPADPTRLVTAQVNATPTWYYVWDTSTDPITQTGFSADTNSAGVQVDGSAIMPDGSRLLVMISGGIGGFTLPALTATSDWYAMDAEQDASAGSFAISSDGSRVALGVTDYASNAAVNIFKSSVSTPYNTQSFPVQGGVGTIGFAADNSRLFLGINRPDATSAFEVDTQPLMVSSTLSLQASPITPDTKVPGSTVKLSGSLRLLDGGAAGSKTVHLSELRPDSSTLDLGSVQTDVSGDYTMASATEPLTQEGTYTFTASFAGDATHLPSQQTVTVPVAKIGSTLQLAATPSALVPGQATTLDGTLSFGDSSSAAARQVSLTMQRPDATVADLGSQTTDANGAFQLAPAEELTQLGTYTFTATYAGDATHAQSQTTATATVSRLVSRLNLHAGKSLVVYGHGTVLTAHLQGGAAGATVRIVRKQGRRSRTIASGKVDADGHLAVKIRPRRSALYRAFYSGDETHSATSSSSIEVAVAPIILGKLSRPYATSRGYHLYHYSTSCASHGSGCPSLTETVIPNLHGHRVYLVLQQHTSSGWQNVVAYRRTLNSHSMATFPIRYLRSSVIGKSYRCVAVFLGNSSYARVAWGPWYFKITR